METKTYYQLAIQAVTPETEIWLGDDLGFLVKKSNGLMLIGLLAGDYMVEFSLGGTSYPITLAANAQLSQDSLQLGPTCIRPAVVI